MNPGEIALLRTKLRELNIEYSALVRRKAEQLRLARLGELRVARQALMTLIAEARRRAGEQFGVALEPEVQLLGAIEIPPVG